MKSKLKLRFTKKFFSVFFSFILIVSSLLISLSVNNMIANAANYTNLALNKTATMTATPYTGHGASVAVDGNATTYAQANTNVLWDFQVDLGSSMTVGRVEVTEDPSVYATAYSIQVSTDNVNWITVATQNSGVGGTTIVYNFALNSARYVKMHVTKATGSYAHALDEFAVYATNTNLALIHTATMNATPYPGHGADQAVDGNLATYAQANTNVLWDLTEDLGSEKTVGQVVIYQDAGNYATNYNIQVSRDGVNYTTVYTQTAGTGSVDTNTFTPTSARYVKMHVNATTGSFAHAVDEFEVYASNTNLALNRTATMTGTPYPGHGADQAVDGNTATYTQANTNVLWDLAVDLGSVMTVGQVVITQDAGNYATNYNIQVSSDGVNYTTVYTQNAGTGGIDTNTFTPTSARYVKMHVNAATGSFAHAVDEFAVYAGSTPGLRNTKIVTPVYGNADIVIADYDVTDYGADSTGVVDSTAAIQQAINDCYSSGGGTVWMPVGTYKVSNTILVNAFVTLRGDWRDPDNGTGSYGTVVSANLLSGDNGPTLFRIGGSAGVMGITVYYPNQSASTPVPYNYTFEIPGNAWTGNNYMMSSVQNVTMLNSYRGIGASMMASDSGGNASSGQVHESETLRNIKGTVLYRGLVDYNDAEFATWENIRFFNTYWANAGATYNAPSLTTLNNWTRNNGIAYTFGDVEWGQTYDLEASDYNIGINFVTGYRISGFSGELSWANIVNSNYALKVDNIDTRWGAQFLRSVLNGGVYSVQNNTTAAVKITDCNITGPTSGTVTITSPGSPTSYSGATIPKVSRAVLYDVSKAPYNAQYTSSTGGTLPTTDATSAIQAALTDAGNAGGGVVYLPAGWYKVNTHLTVPANVELRGSSSVPQRDLGGYSAGTVLFAYEGENTSTPDTDTAFITLNGNTAGVNGLRVFYPTNNPAIAIEAFPFTIRGNGSSTYVVNVGLTNSYNGIDMQTYRNDNHYVRKVAGTVFRNGIWIGPSIQGWVEGFFTNPNVVARVGYNISGWVQEANIFTQVINNYTKPNEKLITVNGASNENMMFGNAYGANTGLYVISGTVNMFNMGTDNVGAYAIQVTAGTVTVSNVMQSYGFTSTGTVNIYNALQYP